MSTFKEQWEQKKLLKKAKKKARNSAMKEHGMTRKEASSAVKKAIGRIMSNKPAVTRAAGRGG